MEHLVRLTDLGVGGGWVAGGRVGAQHLTRNESRKLHAGTPSLSLSLSLSTVRRESAEWSGGAIKESDILALTETASQDDGDVATRHPWRRNNFPSRATLDSRFFIGDSAL